MALTHDEDGFWARRDGVELRVEGGAKPRERGRGFFEQAGVLVRLEVDDFDGFVGEIVGRGVQLMGTGQGLRGGPLRRLLRSRRQPLRADRAAPA